jgi:hypothetical protein
MVDKPALQDARMGPGTFLNSATPAGYLVKKGEQKVKKFFRFL